MEIKTKYNLKQNAYFIQNYHIEYGTIDRIEICTFNSIPTPCIQIKYYITSINNRNQSIIEEKYLFETKEELIDKLINN